MKFNKAGIEQALRASECAWSEDWQGRLTIQGFNSTPRATILRAVKAAGGKLKNEDLGDGFTQVAIVPATAVPMTVQYEMTIARRGQITTTVKERSFPSEAALERWADKNAGNVKILRYLKEAK